MWKSHFLGEKSEETAKKSPARITASKKSSRVTATLSLMPGRVRRPNIPKNAPQAGRNRAQPDR